MNFRGYTNGSGSGLPKEGSDSGDPDPVGRPPYEQLDLLSRYRPQTFSFHVKNIPLRSASNYCDLLRLHNLVSFIS